MIMKDGVGVFITRPLDVNRAVKMHLREPVALGCQSDKRAILFGHNCLWRNGSYVNTNTIG